MKSVVKYHNFLVNLSGATKPNEAPVSLLMKGLLLKLFTLYKFEVVNRLENYMLF